MNPQEMIESAMSTALTSIAAVTALSIVLTVLAIVLVRRYIAGLSGADIRNAESAKATVLKIWDTGTTVNENPVARMLLQVQPTNGQPYQVETKSLIPRFAVAQVQPGAVVQVKIDPAQRNRVKVDFSVA